jgi:ElaB/YqjD/DUF883 family membrane-anchored ribosome-binding protein
MPPFITATSPFGTRERTHHSEEMIDMVNPVVKDIGSAARSAQDTAETTVAEMRNRVSELAKEVATIAEKRTRAAREMAADAADTGATELRRNIRKQPVVAMGVAVAAGAVLALLIVPRFSRPTPASRWDRWAPNVTKADFYDFADNIQRSVSRAANAAAAPVTPAFERMVDALSRADTSSMNSIVERLGGWFQKAQDKAKETVGR